MNSQGRNAFRLQYEISPIVLTGGIAGLPGSNLPIISITQAKDFPNGVLGDSSIGFNLDDAFAHFYPMQGSTLIDNDIGAYPFANQTVAANAIITNPLRVSMLMICPVREEGGYQSKLSTFANLKSKLAEHNNLGGTYTVSTPAYIYQNCIMTGFRDVSGGEDKQKQSSYQIDFIQPLLTTADAQAALNSQMRKITDQTQFEGDPPPSSGRQLGVGRPSSGIGPSVVPAGTGLIGVSVGAFLFSGNSVSGTASSLPGDLTTELSAVQKQALSSLSASQRSSRIAQAALDVIGNAPAASASLLAGRAATAAQAAIYALGGGSQVLAAQRSLSMSGASLGAARFSLQSVTGVITSLTDAPAAALSSVTAAEQAYQAAQLFLGSVT